MQLLARHQTIHDGLRVTDVGAGNALVGRLLSVHANVDYAPYDLLPQANVTELDVRDGVPGPADVLFALGLVEYLPADDLFISRLAAACDVCVVSYVHLDETTNPLSKRKMLGWQRHQTADEFAADFVAAGFGLVGTDSVDGVNRIWLWRRNPA